MSSALLFSKSRHLAGLDGLRAIAVLAVIFYHLNLSDFFPGGFLGVDIFFTLSGFLITSLLLREKLINGKVDLKRFYIHRFRRLAPAMLAVIGVCSVLVLFFAEDAADQLRKDITPALLYYSNWWQIFSEQSYFEMMNRPPLLQHLWSLAIEEQFYLIWPLILSVAVAIKGRSALLLVATLITLITAAWMALLAVQGNIPIDADPNRLYLGTDTHTSGLFAGAMLACLWDPWRLDTSFSNKFRSPRIALIVGTFGLATLFLFFIIANETQSWLYRGGFLLVALATAATIVGSTAPESFYGRVLGSPILRYLGERSYGLYLWHWPIFVLIRPQDFIIPQVATELLRLFLTLLAAELSFRYIESPLRHGSLNSWSRFQKVGVLFVTVVGVSSVLILHMVERSPSVISLEYEKNDINAVNIPDNIDLMPEAARIGSNATACPEGNCLATETVQDDSFSGAVPGPVDMLAIGDSVMLGARHWLFRGLPGVWVDAQVGRQGRDAIHLVKKLKQEGKLPATVLIHMGTNGYLPASLFRQLIAELSDRKLVVLVNVKASRRWASDNNRLLAEFDGGKFKNVVLVNWEKISEGRNEYFVSDGVHLTGKGIRAYVDAIRRACGISGAFLKSAQIASVNFSDSNSSIIKDVIASAAPESQINNLTVEKDSQNLVPSSLESPAAESSKASDPIDLPLGDEEASDFISDKIKISEDSNENKHSNEKPGDLLRKLIENDDHSDVVSEIKN